MLLKSFPGIPFLSSPIRKAIFLSALFHYGRFLLKYSLDRLELPGDISPEKIVDKVQEAGGIILPLGPEIAASYHRLPRAHTDPFDRMLVWQAIQSNYTLISKDREMKKYRSYGLSLLW